MSVKHDDLVRAIRLYLSQIGALSVKVDTPGLLFDKAGRPVRLGRKGVMDIIACVNGRFVAIDAKVGKDRLKPDQAKYAKAVDRAGGIAFAAWSVDDVALRLGAEGLL